MSVKVAGIWDIWHFDKRDEWRKEWQYILKHFNVDQFYMTPDTGVGEQLRRDNNLGIQYVHERNSFEEIITENSEFTPVVVDENGTSSLIQFAHPENALYIFGKTGYSPLNSLNWKGQSVHIDSPAGIEVSSEGLFHPHQAASVVLYDRMVKLWQ